MVDTAKDELPKVLPVLSSITAAAVQAKALEIASQPGAPALASAAEAEGEDVVRVFREKGWKSTEFWITLLVVLIGSGFAGVQLYQGKLDAAGAAAFLGAVMKAASYTAGRSAIKAAAAKSE
jgi:hypothetical protein